MLKQALDGTFKFYYFTQWKHIKRGCFNIYNDRSWFDEIFLLIYFSYNQKMYCDFSNEIKGIIANSFDFPKKYLIVAKTSYLKLISWKTKHDFIHSVSLCHGILNQFEQKQKSGIFISVSIAMEWLMAFFAPSIDPSSICIHGFFFTNYWSNAAAQSLKKESMWTFWWRDSWKIKEAKKATNYCIAM